MHHDHQAPSQLSRHGPRAFALIYLALSLGVIGFQLGLVLGMPWGALAMGGAYPGVYPPMMRLAALAAIGALAAMAYIVLSRVGLVRRRGAGRLIWGVVAMAALASVMNGMTPSPMERMVFLPVSLLLLASSLGAAILTRATTMKDKTDE